MGRPTKSLLKRCYERSFRVRHHAHLLASEPDLPHPELAEFQRRAREAETEDAVKEIARSFKRTLDSLPPEQLQLLPPTQPPVAPDEPGEQQPPAPAAARRERNQALLVALYAALAELPTRFRTRLTAPEEIEAELIRRAAERLAEIDQRLAEEGLSVAGSRRQLRPHPLLAFEAGLRRELTRSLRQLERTVSSRAQFERLSALTRDDPAPDRARGRRQP